MTSKTNPEVLNDAELDQASGGGLIDGLIDHKDWVLSGQSTYSFDLVNTSDISTSDTKISSTLNDSQLKWTR